MFLPAAETEVQILWDITPCRLAKNQPHGFYYSVKQSEKTFLGLIDPPHTKCTLHSFSVVDPKYKEKSSLRRLLHADDETARFLRTTETTG